MFCKATRHQKALINSICKSDSDRVCTSSATSIKLINISACVFLSNKNPGAAKMRCHWRLDGGKEFFTWQKYTDLLVHPDFVRIMKHLRMVPRDLWDEIDDDDEYASDSCTGSLGTPDIDDAHFDDRQEAVQYMLVDDEAVAAPEPVTKRPRITTTTKRATKQMILTQFLKHT